MFRSVLFLCHSALLLAAPSAGAQTIVPSAPLPPAHAAPASRPARAASIRRAPAERAWQARMVRPCVKVGNRMIC